MTGRLSGPESSRMLSGGGRPLLCGGGKGDTISWRDGGVSAVIGSASPCGQLIRAKCRPAHGCPVAIRIRAIRSVEKFHVPEPVPGGSGPASVVRRGDGDRSRRTENPRSPYLNTKSDSCRHRTVQRADSDRTAVVGSAAVDALTVNGPSCGSRTRSQLVGKDVPAVLDEERVIVALVRILCIVFRIGGSIREVFLGVDRPDGAHVGLIAGRA